jgi:hypothetical protein
VPAPLDEVVIRVLEKGHKPRWKVSRPAASTASARTGCATRSRP